MSWAWELLDLNGVTAGILSPRSVSVTRKLNGASTIQVVLEADDLAALSSTAHVIRGWRDPVGGGSRVARATGKVSSIQASANRDSIESMNLFATDGFGVLADRLHDAATTFTDTVPGEIVLSLVASQNGRGNTGIFMDQMDPYVAGPPRARSYEKGKNVADAIRQLAEVDDGFYFRCDPYDGYEELPGWWYWTALVLLYPTPGSDSDASFEWGEGTVGNLAGVQADVLPPINYAFAFGAGIGTEQLVAEKQDTASQEAFGLYDTSSSYSDVIEQATLDQHALDMLRPAERRTFRVSVSPPSGAADLTVPSPWDDFDVGDTVRLNLRGRSAALQYTGRALVQSFTVSIDSNGIERLSSLDFQEG